MRSQGFAHPQPCRFEHDTQYRMSISNHDRHALRDSAQCGRPKGTVWDAPPCGPSVKKRIAERVSWLKGEPLGREDTMILRRATRATMSRSSGAGLRVSPRCNGHYR